VSSSRQRYSRSHKYERYEWIPNAHVSRKALIVRTSSACSPSSFFVESTRCWKFESSIAQRGNLIEFQLQSFADSEPEICCCSNMVPESFWLLAVAIDSLAAYRRRTHGSSGPGFILDTMIAVAAAITRGRAETRNGKRSIRTLKRTSMESCPAQLHRVLSTA
jgi:hypothetical protein